MSSIKFFLNNEDLINRFVIWNGILKARDLAKAKAIATATALARRRARDYHSDQHADGGQNCKFLLFLLPIGSMSCFQSILYRKRFPSCHG